MKKFLMATAFLAVVYIFSPAVAKAQYSTYSPPWNPPGPDVTQAIIEKNMMRDRLRRNAKKGGKASSVKRRNVAKKKTVRKKTRRVAALEFVNEPSYGIDFVLPKKSSIA